MPTTVKKPPDPRAAIGRMHPYEWEPPSARIARQAGVPEDQVVRFDTNTFPWPGARLESLPPEPLNEYPDTSYGTLTEAIAQYTDVPFRMLVAEQFDRFGAPLEGRYRRDEVEGWLRGAQHLRP